MSKGGTTVARPLPDGTLVRVLPDGSTEPFPPDGTNWEAVRGMSDAQVEALAQSDADNPPLTPEREGRLKRVPQVKVMRRAMGLTQEDFSARFRIPLGTLRDWEQGKTEPDQAARAYLIVIARDPEAVTRALRSGPEA
jgi:putative transcriptional regulator